MKKYTILGVLAFIGLTVQAQTNRFDVNRDNDVNVTDVTNLVDFILTNSAYNAQYDVFEDGQVNVVDVTTLVDYILGKGPSDTKSHTAVDLGLASGTLWAAYNLGADTPIGYGNYYSWGETEPKADYSRSAYKYYKYSQYQSIGTEISGTEYDAAHVNWGGAWKLPTKEQMDELMACEWTGAIVNSIAGYWVTGPNGNKIFMPCAGACSDDSGAEGTGTDGYYWTGNQVPGRIASAYCISTSDIGETWWVSRYNGFPIRPVR